MKRISLICAAALLLSGCSSIASRQTAMPVAIADPAPQNIEKGYAIAPGDVLSISVYGEKDMDQPELVVRPDGKVTFPLVGDIAVGGLTTSEVKQELDKKLHAVYSGGRCDSYRKDPWEPAILRGRKSRQARNVRRLQADDSPSGLGHGGRAYHLC